MRKFEKNVVHDGLPAIYKRLWRFCYALSGTRDRANDLAQASALRAIEKAHLFDPATHLDRWVFKVAQRLWFSQLRAETVRRDHALHVMGMEHEFFAETDTETKILASQVLSKVGKLLEAQRVVVVLVCVEGLSYQETADIIEVPVGTVMSRLFAARSKLAPLASEEQYPKTKEGRNV